MRLVGRQMKIGVAVRLLLALALLGVATAQATDNSLWLREPAISPDGTKIAFRFQGQIFIVPAAGGDALPLTQGGFHSGTPVWSPDSSTIAFAADRFGPMNIFAVPATGGDAKRLTWYSQDEKPSSFTPDGKAVLFSSKRLGDAQQTFAMPNRFEQGNQLYQVRSRAGATRSCCRMPHSMPASTRKASGSSIRGRASSSPSARDRPRALRARSMSMTRQAVGMSG